MEKGDFNIENLPVKRREIAEIALEIQRRVLVLIESRSHSSKLQEISGECRSAVDAVMEDRSIAGLRKRFQALFIRLKQREGIKNKNPLYDGREVLKEADFRKMKRTLWKTALEILADPMDRAALPEKMSFEEGVKYLAIDPSRISRHVFFKFGMEIRDFEEQVNLIKEILQNLEPLVPGRKGYYPGTEVHRFYRVTDGAQKGMLLGTQHRGREKYFYLTDVYSALMRQDHILRSRTDILSLDELERVIGEVADYVSKNWEHVKKDESVRGEQHEKILRLFEKLRHAKNPIKVKMKETLALANFKDSSGKFNLGAWFARVVNRVREYLNAMRREQLVRIDSYIAKDRKILIAIISGQKQPFEDFYKKVQNAASDPNSLLGRFLGREENWDENDLNEIMKGHKYDCYVMHQKAAFAPFLGLAEKFQTASGGFFGSAGKYSCGQCKKEDVVRTYINVFLITKLEHIYRLLERMHYMLSFFSRTLHLDDVAKALENLQNYLTQSPIAPHIKTKAYSKEWQRYRETTEEMSEILRNGQTANKTEADIFSELKEILRENLRNANYRHEKGMN